MTKTKVLVIASFVATFAAGAAVGMLVWRAGSPPPRPSWLASELNLTDEQRDQMHQIWSEVAQASGAGHWDRRRAFAQERDQAVAALMTEAQKPEHEKILQEYTRKTEEMAQERERAFAQAVERTKQILTPEQAAKYEELLKEREKRGPGERPGPPGPWGRRPPRHGPPERTPEDRPAPNGGGEACR